LDFLNVNRISIKSKATKSAYKKEIAFLYTKHILRKKHENSIIYSSTSKLKYLGTDLTKEVRKPVY
jgi:hypothetical protein